MFENKRKKKKKQLVNVFFFLLKKHVNQKGHFPRHEDTYTALLRRRGHRVDGSSRPDKHRGDRGRPVSGRDLVSR